VEVKMTDEKRYIYYLSEYNWYRVELLKENRTTYKINYIQSGGAFPGTTKNAPKEKCAFPDEKVCIVYETWKGVNGRGGHRVEREKYTKSRIPAKDISRQGYFCPPHLPASDHEPGRVWE